MIGFAADGANIMMGKNNSLASKLKADIPHLFILKCVCHSIHLVASNACQKLPGAVEDLARDIHNFLNGSPKRLDQYKEFQSFTELKPHKLLQPLQTRWLSLEAVVCSLLEQYEALRLYFLDAAFSDGIKATENISAVLEDPVNKLYLHFLQFVLEIFNILNRSMQSESSNIHCIHRKVVTCIKTILECYMKDMYIPQDNDFKNLDYKNLRKYLPIEEWYFGAKFATSLTSSNIDQHTTNNIKFSCLEFYKEAIKQLLHRFPDGEMTLLKKFEFLDPNTVMDRKLKSISDVVAVFPNLKPEEKVQIIDTEWRLLRNSVTDININKNDSVEAFWKTISQVENGEDNSAKFPQIGRSRDEGSGKKGSNACNSDCSKRNSMDSIAQGENFEGKDTNVPEKGTNENKDDTYLNDGVVSSTQEETSTLKRLCPEDCHEIEVHDEELSKRKKRKDNEDKEIMGKPAPVQRAGPGRSLTGSKPPGPASKTGASPLGKSGTGQGTGKGGSGNSKGLQGQGKSGGGKVQNSHQGKGIGGKGASQCKQDRKSPVASPKPNQSKDGDGEGEEPKAQEAAALKVPPLKIVIPGGAANSAGRNEPEEGGSGQRGSGKGRGSASTLPYVIPCTSADPGQTSDSSDGNIEDKRANESGKAGQRVLRSHRTNDGDKDKERTSPHMGSESRSGSSQTHSALNSNKSPPCLGSNQDDHAVSGSSGGSRSESSKNCATVELHPRKRKIKSSKDHSKDHHSKNNDPPPENSTQVHNVTHSNPYQMYIHIRKQIDRRQKSLFPVKPKPPKDFNKYLMNRRTYTLQSNVNMDPPVEVPHNLPPQMVNEFLTQEKERTRLRIQHLVEKEKLVLAVEQEILRVHGRAERAVANQALPFSVCTILRDKEVYNVLAPEQEEKRNAQRSRCNGRQINSWLQEVDDKWEKIKEGMLRRQHTEAETLHAVQMMGWEWKLKELGICDYKTTPKIDPAHVPQIHVSNFDLPA